MINHNAWKAQYKHEGKVEKVETLSKRHLDPLINK